MHKQAQRPRQKRQRKLRRLSKVEVKRASVLVQPEGVMAWIFRVALVQEKKMLRVCGGTE